MAENTLSQTILTDKEGYKSLNANGLERLRELGKSDSELAYIDKTFKYKAANEVLYNFANTNTAPDISFYMKQLNKSTKDATKGYCKMLRNCYPNEYYGSDYQGSNWMKIEFNTVYNIELLDKTKTKNPIVPSFDNFCSYFKKLPYYTETKIKQGEEVKVVGQFTERGIESLDAKYQQYLKDIWPEYWLGKIFSDRTEVTQDNIDKNLTKLCQYTYRDILVDTVEATGTVPIEEAHYFAIFCGNEVDTVLNWTASQLNPYREAVKKPITIQNMISLPQNILKIEVPKNLSAAENSMDKLIEKLEKLQEPNGGLPALLKNTLLSMILPIVAGIVWEKVKPYISLNDPNNIDPKQMCKDALKQMLNDFKENTAQMCKDALKEVTDTINEIIVTTKGMWDNIIALPKTAVSMCTSAAMPQTIPTTGGIPNPITVILDIMNIIDSILALFPPIIQDLLKILTLLKKLMLTISELPFLARIIDVISNLIRALKAKKDTVMTDAQIHKAVKKALKKMKKIKNRRDNLVDRIEHGRVILKEGADRDEYDEYNQTITDIESSIRELERRCSIHGTLGGSSETDNFNSQIKELNSWVFRINNIKIDVGGSDGNDDDIIEDLNALWQSMSSGQSETNNNSSIATTNNTSTGNNMTGNATSRIDTNGNNTNTTVASPLQETNVTPYCGKVFV